MSEESHAVITTESNLNDPHQFLPDEMFCHSLSFLSPSGIAISSAVSRNWRASNLADPTLYSVIDLSRPHWWFREYNEDQSDDERLEEEMELYLFHFERLSSLASNRVKKVSLNLACFFSDFEDNDIDENTRLVELLSILTLSSAILEEVLITLKFDEMLKYVEPEEPSSLGCFFFVQTILQHLTDHYPNLRKIELSAPICISFQAGTDQTGFKQISIRDGDGTFFSKGDFPNADTIRSLIKAARDFAGTGLTGFFLDTDDEEMDPEWYDEILSELWTSRSTLQHLELDKSALSTRKAWELVMSCRNLLTPHWDSTLPYNQSGIELRVEAGEEISLQEVAEIDSFKNISITSDSGWRSIVKWIGNGRGLEVLELSGEHISEEEEEVEEVAEDISSSGLSLGHILRNARDTLKRLHLSDNALGNLSFLPSALPFPKLRVLRLRDCSLQLWSEISKLQSLQLCSLDVWLDWNHCSEDYGARQEAQAFDCLVSILQENSTLTSVEFSIAREASSSTLQKHLELHHSTSKLSFKLHSLRIKSLAASKWFSQHHYPNLKELEVDEEYHPQFKNIPMELQAQIEMRS